MLDGIRVHRGPGIDDKAKMLGAAAFSHGTRIGLNSHAATPGSAAETALLAHELAHIARGDTGIVRRAPLAEQVPKDIDPGSIAVGVSFDLPGGIKLQSSFASDVTTVNPTTVRLTLSRTGLDIAFNPSLLIDLNFLINIAASDLTWSGARYDFATASSSVTVNTGDPVSASTVAPELAGTVSGMISGLVAGTPAATAGYDPLLDPDPTGTVQQIQRNFANLPRGGGDSITPDQITNVTLSGSFSTARDISQSTAEGGVRIPAGTSIAISARMQGSAADLGGQEPPKMALLTLGTSGIILQSGGEDVVRITALSVAPGGAVSVTGYEALGAVAEAETGESGVRALGLLLLLSGAEPNDRLALSRIDPDPLLRPRFVQGLTLARVNSVLTGAVRQLIIDNAWAIPGVNLMQIFSVEVQTGPGDFPLPSGLNRYG